MFIFLFMFNLPMFGTGSSGLAVYWFNSLFMFNLPMFGTGFSGLVMLLFLLFMFNPVRVGCILVLFPIHVQPPDVRDRLFRIGHVVIPPIHVQPRQGWLYIGSFSYSCSTISGLAFYPLFSPIHVQPRQGWLYIGSFSYSCSTPSGLGLIFTFLFKQSRTFLIGFLYAFPVSQCRIKCMGEFKGLVICDFIFNGNAEGEAVLF